MCMPPLFAPLRRMAELTPFLPPLFPPPEITFFWGDFNCHHPSAPAGWKYLTGSPLLTSSPSLTLTSPLLIVSCPFLGKISNVLLIVPGWYFRTWVLTTYQFFHLSLSLRTFTPTSFPLPSTFRKLAGMTLPPTLTLTALLQRHTRLFLFSLLLLSLPLWH